MAGAAEHNMETFSCFDTVGVPGATVYRKSKEAFPKTTAAKVTESLDLSRAANARGPAPPKIEPPPTIDELRRLADRGDLENAVQHCNSLLARDGLNPIVHFYQALLLEPMGREAEAERSLRQAIYLDRNFLLAHYHLGLALAKGKQPRRAARSFENVLRLSGGTRDEQTLDNGDGVTVAGLKQLAKMHLKKLGDL